MNTYKYNFTVICPNDNALIDYHLEIRSTEIIMAESIVKYCDNAEGYQECIAEGIKEEIGGAVKVIGIHSGVEITTEL